MTTKGEETLDVEVDLDKCAGYGNCIEAASDYFAMNAEGKAIALAPPAEGYQPKLLKRAARLCPANAVLLTAKDQF